MSADFSSSFQSYLTSHSDEISRDAHLLTLLNPIFGLANAKRYETWKLSSDMRYFEASNLIAQMFESPSPLLKELGATLVEEGYDAISASDVFPQDVVDDQMKLIYFIMESI